jgi:lysophospholipase L1-like esterase
MTFLQQRSLRRPAVAALWAVIAGLALACGSTADGGLEPSPTPSVEQPVYLALGDSLAIGVGASDWAHGGYVARLLERLDASGATPEGYELQNVSRSGADTRSVINDGQLQDALTIIRERRETPSAADDVEVITVGLGGNDGFSLVPVCNGVVDDACLEAARVRIAEVRTNLEFIVERLRDAAGPEVRIAVMTYYNPLIHEGCPLHEFEPIGDVVLEGEADLGVAEGLNDEIRAAAADTGVPVAEVGDLNATELTGDCLHANDAGHVRIAAAFEAALIS